MKKLLTVIIVLVLSVSFSCHAAAFSPYENYTYPAEEEGSLEDTQAYLPEEIITGETLGTTNFLNPEDIYVSTSRQIYVVDTGNNRIVVFDENQTLLKVIDGFDNSGTADAFSGPKGIFVDEDDNLYIADSGNDRIVVLDISGNLKKIVTLPQSVLLDGIKFSPEKVVVDHSGRIFAISPNTNKGIIGIDAQGNFTGFYGVLKTNGTFDLFKYFATDPQRETMEQSVPVAYSNMDIDVEGFVYTSVALTDISGDYNPDIFIRKLNPSGNDVLNRNGNHDIIGDVIFYKNAEEQENSSFCDVTFVGENCYSALDQRYGRIFTYDKDGNLLFVFGAKGGSLGQFYLPVSLDVLDKTYYVLDRNYNQIVVFKPTEYGELLLNASNAYNNRNYDEAEEYYDRLLELSVYSDVVYQGKANCLYHNQEYGEAMKYYKLCENKDMYIEAFKYYRNDLIDRYFMYAMTTIVILVIVLVGVSFIRKRKRRAAHE